MPKKRDFLAPKKTLPQFPWYTSTEWTMRFLSATSRSTCISQDLWLSSSLCLLLVAVPSKHADWRLTHMADPQIPNLPKMIPKSPLMPWPRSTVISTGSGKYSTPQNCRKYQQETLSLNVSLSLSFPSFFPLQLQQRKRRYQVNGE